MRETGLPGSTVRPPERAPRPSAHAGMPKPTAPRPSFRVAESSASLVFAAMISSSCLLLNSESSQPICVDRCAFLEPTPVHQEVGTHEKVSLTAVKSGYVAIVGTSSRSRAEVAK
jgi:hypothetical protein